MKQRGDFNQIETFMNSVAKLHMPSTWVGQQRDASIDKVTKEELKARYQEAAKAAEKAFG